MNYFPKRFYASRCLQFTQLKSPAIPNHSELQPQKIQNISRSLSPQKSQLPFFKNQKLLTFQQFQKLKQVVLEDIAAINEQIQVKKMEIAEAQQALISNKEMTERVMEQHKECSRSVAELVFQKKACVDQFEQLKLEQFSLKNQETQYVSIFQKNYRKNQIEKEFRKLEKHFAQQQLVIAELENQKLVKKEQESQLQKQNQTLKKIIQQTLPNLNQLAKQEKYFREKEDKLKNDLNKLQKIYKTNEVNKNNVEKSLKNEENKIGFKFERFSKLQKTESELRKNTDEIKFQFEKLKIEAEINQETFNQKKKELEMKNNKILLLMEQNKKLLIFIQRMAQQQQKHKKQICKMEKCNRLKEKIQRKLSLYKIFKLQ